MIMPQNYLLKITYSKLPLADARGSDSHGIKSVVSEPRASASGDFGVGDFGVGNFGTAKVLTLA